MNLVVIFLAPHTSYGKPSAILSLSHLQIKASGEKFMSIYLVTGLAVLIGSEAVLYLG